MVFNSAKITNFITHKTPPRLHFIPLGVKQLFVQKLLILAEYYEN
jgi:hypothetical protein